MVWKIWFVKYSTFCNFGYCYVMVWLEFVAEWYRKQDIFCIFTDYCEHNSKIPKDLNFFVKPTEVALDLTQDDGAQIESECTMC